MHLAAHGLRDYAARRTIDTAAGTYTVRFWAFSVLGGGIGPVNYSLQGYAALDAIGLTTTDTTTTDTGTSTTFTPRVSPP